MGRKFKLSTGEVADVEEADLRDFLTDMRTAGLKVKLVDDAPSAPAEPKSEPIGEVVIGKPEVIKTPQRSELFVEPDPTGAVGGGSDSEFRNWYAGVSKKLGLAPNPDDKEHYYDYRGFYDSMKRGEVKSPDQPGGHWPSQFKSPDHPRAYLLDPIAGRYFDTESGKYTGGAREPVAGDRMEKLNGMDLPDLGRSQWAEARGGADKPVVIKTTVVTEKPESPLSSETRDKAADTAPSNPENKDNGPGWIRGLIGGDSTLTPEQKDLANSHGERLEANGSMQAGRDYVAALNDPLKFTKMLAGAGLNFAGQAVGGGGAGGWLSGLVRGAAGGALTSGGAALARDEDADHALKDVRNGALVGGTMGGVLGGLGDIAQGAARLWGKGADRARLAAYGVGNKDLKDLAEESGTSVADAANQLVRDGERLAPPNRVMPISAAGYEDRFRGAARDLNNTIEDAIVAAQVNGGRLPSDVRGEVVRGIDQEANNALNSGRGSGFSMGSALRREANAADIGPQYTTPWDVRGQKIALDKEAYSGEPGSELHFADRARKVAADQYRGILNDYVQSGAPLHYPQFQAANQDYGTAALLRDSAASQAAQDATGGGWVPKIVGPAVGAVSGALVGGVPGASAGAALGYASRNLPGAYGADLGANLARLAQGSSDWVGAASNEISRLAPAAAGAVTAARRPVAPQSDAYNQSETNNDSQGHLVAQKLQNALRTNPDAFGQYLDDFTAVADDPDRLTALYERLSRDPRSSFARDVAPLINGSANR